MLPRYKYIFPLESVDYFYGTIYYTIARKPGFETAIFFMTGSREATGTQVSTLAARCSINLETLRLSKTSSAEEVSCRINHHKC